MSTANNTIYINTDLAEKKLEALKKKAVEFEGNLKKLEEGTEAWNKENAKLEKVNKNIDTLSKQVSGEIQPSMRQLTEQVKKLSAELKHLPVGSTEFVSKTKELQTVEGRLKNVQNEVKGVGGAFGKIKTEVKQFGMLAAGYLGFEFVTNALSGIIRKNAELSDSLADMRKTTGMTTGEVEELNKSLGKINTRTAAKELRNIAVIAGQLGIDKSKVLGFTEAVDKAVVALGDEFTGGAEQVAKELGALRNVFSDVKSDAVDQDLLRIGNALNELGASGAATGPVVADFANRIGGVGINLGLTSDQVLGLSATLQELNVSTERGGTAVVGILQKMTTNTEAFAKVAGMSTKDFANLVDKDLYGAFLKVVEGSQKSATSATQFGALLDSLKLDGAGASEVFSKLGSNTTLLAEKVTLAGSALKSTSSITDEFNIKNETMGAKLEKLSKSISGFFSTGFINEFVTGAINGLSSLLSTSDSLTESFEKQSKVVSDLETNAVPLIKRYEELKGKGKLNKDEQKELNTVIEQLSKAIPTAVTEWDKYGKAMGINTQQAKEFIEQQKAMKEEMNKDAIKEQESRLHNLENSINATHAALNRGTKVQTDSRGLFAKEVALTAKEVTALANDLQNLQRQKLGVTGILNDLKGISNVPKTTTASAAKGVSDSSPIAPIITIPGTPTKEKADKHVKDLTGLLERFYEKIESLNAKELESKMAAIPKEIAAINDKYTKLIDEAKEYLLKEKDLTDAQKKELLGKISSLEKANEAERSNYLLNKTEELNNDLADLNKKLIATKQTQDQVELASINAKYDALRIKYSGFAAAMVLIEKARLTEIDEFDKKKAAEKLERYKKVEEQLAFNRKSDKDKEELAAIDAINKKYEQSLIDAVGNSKLISEIETQKTEETEKAKLEIKQKYAQQALNESIQLATTISNSAFQIYNQAQENQTNKELASLQKKKEYELSNKYLTEDQKAEIDQRYKRREGDIRKNAFEAQRKAAITQAIINGALAVTNIIATMPWADFGVAHGIAIAGAALSTAAQVKLISGQQPPAFADGGLTMAKGGLTNGPFLALAGEEGVEWISPNWMVTHPATANTIAALEQMRQRGPTAFANGGATTGALPVVNQPSTTGQSESMLIGPINTLNSYLKKVLDSGIKAHISQVSVYNAAHPTKSDMANVLEKADLFK